MQEFLFEQVCGVSVCERFFTPKTKASKTCPDCYTEGLYQRELNLKTKYNLTIAEYETMFQEQGGVCAICSESDPKGKGFWHVDHDHMTGKVRGILCDWCNRGLGQYRDNVNYLMSAAAYLIKNSELVTNSVTQPEEVNKTHGYK